MSLVKFFMNIIYQQIKVLLFMKIYQNSIIKGTFILMFAGIITRFLGFYYRIFLSSRIGAEGMGLYQMIFPVYGLCLSLCASGIQVSISRFVSGREKCSLKTLAAGLSIALPLSLICSVIIFFGSDIISSTYLNEPRCSILLKFSAISLPMAVIHSCVNGYFLGKKKAFVPGISQFIEQLARVATAWCIFFMANEHLSDDIVSLAVVAVIGLVAGEFVSMLVSIIATIIDNPISKRPLKGNYYCSVKRMVNPLAKMAFPLTMTNLILGLVHSLEATAIPFFLNKYGLTYGNAISIYGILTAMAMPFITFPTTVTGAVSRMLLPTIAAAEAERNYERISKLSLKTLKYSALLGMFCTCFFALTGEKIGKIVYNNETAGDFITILAWLCPLMFISGTVGSILHGLGLTKTTFYQNMAGSLLRLSFTIFAIPVYGIKGYLWGILASELLCTVLHTGSMLNYIHKNKEMSGARN